MMIWKNQRLRAAGIAAVLFVCALAVSWLLGGMSPPHAPGYANYGEGHYEDGRGGLYYLVEENQTEIPYYYNTRSKALRSLCEQPDCRHHNKEVEQITCGIEQETLDGAFYDGYFYCFGGGEDIQEEENVYPPSRYDAPDYGFYRMRRPDAPREPVFLLEEMKKQFQTGKAYNTLIPQTFCIAGGRVYLTVLYHYGSITGQDVNGYNEYDGGSAGYLCSYDLRTGAFSKLFMVPQEALCYLITDGKSLYISSYDEGSYPVYDGETLMLPAQNSREKIYRYDLATGERKEVFACERDDMMYGL